MLRIWKRSGRQEFPSKIKGPPVAIVSDAAIAMGAVGDGRFVPLVILDTTDRPDMAELIAVQERLPPGDVVSAWARLLNGPKDHLALILQFQRLFETTCVLNFDLSKQGSVVELALRASAIYLQAGKPDDRLYRTLGSPRLIVELGAELPPTRWHELWLKAIKRKLRSEGLRGAEAKKIAARYIEEMRTNLKDPRSFGAGIYIDPQTSATNDADLTRKGE